MEGQIVNSEYLKCGRNVAHRFEGLKMPADDARLQDYVFITKSLSERIDFYQKNRFKYYKDCPFFPQQTENKESVHEFENSGNDTEDEYIQENNIHLVISKNGHGYLPIAENLESPEDESVSEPRVSVSKLIKSSDRLKFALFSIDYFSHHFLEILQHGVPFALISPDGLKCEWINLAKDRTLPSSKCVDCKERKCPPEQQNCVVHEKNYTKNDAIRESVFKYQSGIDDLLNPHILQEVPIFEFSTGIDIVRWHYFNEKYSMQKRIVEKRNLGATENFIEGMVQVLKQNK